MRNLGKEMLKESFDSLCRLGDCGAQETRDLKKFSQSDFGAHCHLAFIMPDSCMGCDSRASGRSTSRHLLARIEKYRNTREHGRKTTGAFSPRDAKAALANGV